MNNSLSQQQIRTARQLITNDIAYYIQYQKRGNSSGGMMSNEEYQLFIDNNNALVYAANNQIVDGMASDYALKIEPNGLLTIKNLKVINFDFVAQINQLINQVNLLQQSIGTTEQDITDIKNDIDTINQELSRQTQFRGYYLLNTDIQNLPNSANGDFSFSAESGTVWMYDADWYNSGDIVPDQVTPASDATPLSDGTATAGISTEYSRGDHVHPLNVTTTIPISDSASGSVGTTNYYARNDHSHPLNITTSISPQDSADGSVGTTNYYARNDHSHPINVETNASNIPIINGVGANGTSAFYARQDHVHPQQLTYDGNVTATKFIKTGGLATEILCANGDTTTIDSHLSRTYSSGAGGYIRLCVFPIGTSIGMPYIQFQVTCNTNSMQTISLSPYYTVNGIIDLFGTITAPQYVQANYNIYSGVDQLLHTHTGSYSSAVYTAWIHIMTGSGSVTVTVSKQSSYQPTRVTEILTQDIVTSITGSQTQIPISYSLGNGGIISNMIQVNPLDRGYGTYSNGIRIGNNNGDSTSSLYLGCLKTAINTTQSGQWEISKTNDKALTITPSSLRQDDHSVGLNINSDSSIIKFNGNELVNVGTDQTINGRKTFKNEQFEIQLTGSNYPLLVFNNNDNYLEQMINSNQMILSIDTSLPDGTPLYINQHGGNLSTQYPDSKLVTKYVLNAGSSTSFAGVTCGTIQINPTSSDYTEGVRIARSSNGSCSGIYLGCNPNSSSGTMEGQWNIVNAPDGQLLIGVNTQIGQPNQGLVISADGQTLTFNGRTL
ncbi:MAG: hypothetical protein EZS28_022040 [Streblomastix strix]|uniref:Uncharacterized protein n=1 Tax=Streblomastix strix TaxID=222440 RepID=A0A5J4VIL6_9EUKA|nr:MAG: hypothetical protein EZS28_022040 [Streblomastix strix]